MKAFFSIILAVAVALSIGNVQAGPARKAVYVAKTTVKTAKNAAHNVVKTTRRGVHRVVDTATR
jgi:hypothetical protein